MSDDKIDTTYNVNDIFQVLSGVGGIMSLLLGLLTTIFIPINRKFIIAKLIRSLYFKHSPDDDQENNKKCSQHTIHFSFMDRFVFIKQKLINVCRRNKQLTKDERYFIKGENQVLNELNIFNIVQRI